MHQRSEYYNVREPKRPRTEQARVEQVRMERTMTKRTLPSRSPLRINALAGWLIFVVVVLILEVSLFNLPHWQTANLTPQTLATQHTLTQDEPAIFEVDTPQPVQTLRITPNHSCEITLGFRDEGSPLNYTTSTHELFLGVPSSQLFQLHPYGAIKDISLTLVNLSDPALRRGLSEDEAAQIGVTLKANEPIPFTFSFLRVLVILGVGALIWAFLPKRRIYQRPAFDTSPHPASEHPAPGYPTSPRLTPFARCILIPLTAGLCVVFLAQLAILPDTLGEYGKGYSTLSTPVAAQASTAQSSSQTQGSDASTAEASNTSGTPQPLSGSGTRAAQRPTPNSSPLAYVYPATYESEYAKLARAFAVGQLHLLDEPPQGLETAENPYDSASRAQAAGARASDYWDTAYYNGKLYVYFGVLPAVVFYLPYFLITGQDLPNFVPIAVCLVVLIAGIARLLVQLARRWMPNVSVGALVLALLLVSLGAQLGWLVLSPSIYQVPVAMGLALLVWAAVCMTSLDRRPLLVVPGALMVALVFACRPQIGLFGLLLVPLGIQALLAKGTLRARMGYLAAALAPVVVVLAAIGLYNALRFGNPLDFGAAYNLTTNDMRLRPMTLDATNLALFSYLFQLPVIEPFFPFLEPVWPYPGSAARSAIQTAWGYAGNITVESPLGGLLWLSPLVWFVLALFWEKGPGCLGKAFGTGQLLGNGLFSAKGMALLCLVFVVVVVILDGEGAGILPRYALDFSLPPLVLGAVGFMALDARRSPGEGPDRWWVALGIIMLLGGVVVTIGVAFHADVIQLSSIYEMARTHALVNGLLFP